MNETLPRLVQHQPILLVTVRGVTSLMYQGRGEYFGVPKLKVVLHTEAMFCHCWLIWPCAVEVPVALFHVTIVRNVIHVTILLSQVAPHMTTGTWYLLRQQADKPKVVPSQHPVYVVGGYIDAGRNVTAVEYPRGWVKSLHLEAENLAGLKKFYVLIVLTPCNLVGGWEYFRWTNRHYVPPKHCQSPTRTQGVIT
jgi:hypothetical protein